MRIYYKYTNEGMYTGEHKNIERFNSYPQLSTFAIMPDIPLNKFARFDGEKWNVVSEYIHPVTVGPQKITAEQAKRAMARTTHNNANLYKTVKTLIKSLDEEDETRIVYEEAKIWHRNNDMIAAIGAAVGLTDVQIDGLFVLGGSIK